MHRGKVRDSNYSKDQVLILVHTQTSVCQQGLGLENLPVMGRHICFDFVEKSDVKRAVLFFYRVFNHSGELEPESR